MIEAVTLHNTVLLCVYLFRRPATQVAVRVRGDRAHRRDCLFSYYNRLVYSRGTEYQRYVDIISHVLIFIPREAND